MLSMVLVSPNFYEIVSKDLLCQGIGLGMSCGLTVQNVFWFV